jgi:hypothetical protein
MQSTIDKTPYSNDMNDNIYTNNVTLSSSISQQKHPPSSVALNASPDNRPNTFQYRPFTS